MEGLSDRELAILRLIGRGCSTRQIAKELALSVGTIGSHRDVIKRKPNVGTAAQLIQYAIGWAQPDDRYRWRTATATLQRAPRRCCCRAQRWRRHANAA